MRRCPHELARSLGVICLLTVSWSASAVDRYDYLITTNKVSMQPGVRLALGVDTAPNPDEPCHLTTASNPTVSMPWSAGGTALGIAINETFGPSYNYVYASISEAYLSNGCTDTDGWCLGTAWYPVSDTDGSPSITRSYDPQFLGTYEPVASDVAAARSSTVDTAVVLNKWVEGDVLQHATANPNTNDSYSGLDELSQVRWASTGFFVATVTGSTTGNVDGSVILGKRMHSGGVPSTAFVYGPAGSKPEGLDVVALDAGNRGSCNADAEYLVYVVDYKNSRLYLYWVDADTGQEGIFEQDVYGTSDPWISLNLDADGDWSTVDGSDSCNPSSVLYHDPTGDVFVACQHRDSILRVETTTDLCDPSWYVGSDYEVRLKERSSGTPSCTTEVPTTDCGGGGDCQPHAVEYDDYVRGGPLWLYVALTEVGQITAVRATDLTNQRVIYMGASATTFKPIDHVMLSSCNPNDEACVYP